MTILSEGLLRDDSGALLVNGLAAAEFPIPTTVSDNFNRANESPLAGSWGTTNFLADATTSKLLGIFGNLAAANSNGDCSQVWGATLGPNVDSYVTIVAGKQASGNVLCGLYLRLTPHATAPSYIALTVTVTAGVEEWELRSVNGGIIASLGTANGAVAVNDKVGLRVEGDTATGYLFHSGSWTQIITATDSGVPSGTGKVALQTEGNATGFDNWTVGTI